jgi:glycosyltransferase involved in cell wall biosynthesis
VLQHGSSCFAASQLEDKLSHNQHSGLRSYRKRDFVLSIVIPCFNEEEVVETTYQKVLKTLAGRDFELQIVFVDDGSFDKTGDIIRRIEACDARVKLISFSRNFGHQAAISAGLATADGDVIGIIDADLQDPPEVIIEMLQKWHEGFDVVYGIRRKRKEAKWKTFCYAGFYRIFRSLSSIKFPLDAGDFSLLDRIVLDEINRLPEKNRYFRGLRAWVGFRQIGVLYERDPRFAGVTKYSLLKLIKLAADGVFNFSTLPLTFVFYIGLTMSLVSFVAILLVLYLRLSNTPIAGVRVSDVQGFASTVLLILLLGGIQLMSIGILGEYIGRIYQEVKGRPDHIRADERTRVAEVSDKGVAKAKETVS